MDLYVIIFFILTIIQTIIGRYLSVLMTRMYLTSVLNHIQTCLLVQLNNEFKKLKEKFAKDYDKIKQKYNLPDEDVKWVPALNQYA